MAEQKNLEHALTICNTLSLEQKAELIKQLLKDSKLLFYSVNFFDEEQKAGMLRAIAAHVVSRANR